MKNTILETMKSFERDHDAFDLTVSIGHFLLHAEDLSAVAYEEGQGAFLAYLERNDWNPIFDGDVKIGCQKDKQKIMLGFGGQIKWVYGPFVKMQEVDQAYLNFIEELFDELKRNNQLLVATGHQPVTKAEDIKAISADKFKAIEVYANNNESYAEYVKSSAQLEVSMQYAHVDNFEKRFQAAAVIQATLAALFDNTAWVAGKENTVTLYNMNRLYEADEVLYHVNGVYEEHFKYDDYAEYLLSVRDFLVANGASEDTILKDVTNAVQAGISMTEYGLTIAMDSVPYPLNMAAILMVKALLYNPDHMTALQKMIEDIGVDKLNSAENSILKKGIDGEFGAGTAFDLVKDLFFMVSLTLEEEEQHYMQPINSLIFKKVRPYQVSSKQFFKMLD